ncbi:MAG: TetR/AcrR family transcriptional regulator, partial [Gammaproteobacteria bacterium]|nr:TetR/AcrR family transcriptional regulator [Gammaproteobacteria bacterium]
NRLLTASAELLVESGISAATFKNIARRAGLSRGLVTRRFGSKSGIIEALIERLQTRVYTELEGRLLAEASGLDAVIGCVNAFLDNFQGDREQRAYFVLLAASVADVSDLRVPFYRTHEVMADLLQNLLRRGVAEGSVRQDLDLRSAALMVGSLLFGLAMQSLLDPKMDLESLRRTVIETVRRGLGRLRPLTA